MTSYVDVDEGISVDFEIEQLVDTLLATVMDFEKCPYEAEISLLVTNSDIVKEMNSEHRGIDATTDVLSFPALEFETPGNFDYAVTHESDAFDPETGELMLGDIVINIDRVYSQAEEYGHSIKREFAFLVTHSLFHLCGYDHMTEQDASDMEKRQEQVLCDLGITRD